MVIVKPTGVPSVVHTSGNKFVNDLRHERALRKDHR